MKLIIHPGLHKTGSTYLQHVLNDHHAQLAARGVWYQPQAAYPAHHDAAWRILQGDEEPLVAMIEAARSASCGTVILSSEDLEGALYDDRPLHAIDDAANQAEVGHIEWHVVLREPGAAFASLFAQLQHHIYSDAFQLFYDIMRRGFAHIAAPMPGSGTPYWYYAFDHLADLERLQKRSGAPVIAHDFTAGSVFPGSGLLERLGVVDAITELPGAAARNARPCRDDIIRGYVSRIAEALPDEGKQARITNGFLACLESGLDNIATYAEMVGDRYADSHRAALARFAETSLRSKPDPVG
ncbi:hypothetical protein [Erythrobacter sp. JK5]|uniref:hypothetical protein n=1 Tax=Erythrobacter sp. JK5 TaxID=2829500 RepID=UPI001BA647F1|nr:hypothetical protein [Erythrobacter sp. JK5]QUL38114.1 hypothetical protein KDC96_01435 [Erythrobacter sp. JK5]